MKLRTVLLIFSVLVNLPVPSFFAATFDWSAEPLAQVKINTVAFRGWVPDTADRLSGVLVLIPGRHGDGRGMADDARWQQLAAETGFAILGCQFADGEPFPYQNDERGEVSRAINTAVDELAKMSGKPELKGAPLALWGTSAGSNVSTCYCKFFPDRVVAFGSSKGTWGPGDNTSGKALDIPMIFAIGAKDKAEWVETSISGFKKGQGKAPWTLALQVNEGHGVESSLDVVVPFLSSAIKQRLGKSTASTGGSASIFKSELPKIGTSAGSTSVKSSLKKISLRDGWLGDPKTFEVAAYSQFKGSKASAIWLPDEAAALAWQAYLKK